MSKLKEFSLRIDSDEDVGHVFRAMAAVSHGFSHLQALCLNKSPESDNESIKPLADALAQGMCPQLERLEVEGLCFDLESLADVFDGGRGGEFCPCSRTIHTLCLGCGYDFVKDGMDAEALMRILSKKALPLL